MDFSAELKLLQQDLHFLRVKNVDDHHFVPEDQLNDLMSTGTVATLLSKISPAYRVPEITDFVLQRATKIFSVLILISEVEQVTRFIEHDQFGTHRVDHQLPFMEIRLTEIFEDRFVASKFYDNQWQFIAVTFSGQVTPRNLEKRTVLPFLSQSYISTGGFGSVWKVKIHPSYKPPDFASTAEVSRQT